MLVENKHYQALYDRGHQVGASDGANGMTFDLEYGDTVAAAKGYSDGFKAATVWAEGGPAADTIFPEGYIERRA